MRMIKKIGVVCGLFTASFANAQVINDGIKALEMDKVNAGKSILLNHVNSNTKDADAYYHLGNLYLENDQIDSAKYVFSKGVEVLPENAMAYVGMGKFHQANKNNAEAAVNFAKALALSKSKDVKVLNALADAYAVAGNPDYPKAIEMGNKSIALDKKNPMSYLTLGDVYLAQNNGSEAIKNYEKALEVNPNFEKAHLRIGKLYAQARNFRASLSAYESAIKINPNYAPAYRDMAELYYLSKQFDKAVENYKRYLDLSERNVNSLSRYASFLFLTKDYSKTTEVINEIMVIDSSNAILSRLKGYSYFEQGEFKLGLESMERFFQNVNPKKIISSDYEYYARLLNKNDMDSLAVLNFQKAIELDTTKVELYGDIADVLKRNKKYPEAIEAYKTKIEKDKSPSALDYFFLGQAYYFNKQYDHADSAFTKVTEMKPMSTAGYFWRARSKAVDVENNLEGPKPFYEKFLELGAPDPKTKKSELVEANRYMGYYYLQNDDNANAKKYYQEVLKLEPDNKEAKEVLKALK